MEKKKEILFNLSEHPIADREKIAKFNALIGQVQLIDYLLGDELEDDLRLSVEELENED